MLPAPFRSYANIGGLQATPFQLAQAGQQRIKREVFNGTWAANTTVTIPMPRN
jgi:hypothetical protein